jgi:alpha-beta hydrolase superfamily lysophospholipase
MGAMLSRVQLKKREADTALCKAAIKVCTACAMLEGFDAVQLVPDRITIPVLALHGEHDTVCPLSKVEEFLEQVASTDVTLKTYPEGLHDMLHDYEKEQVRADILEFIATRA